MLRSQGTANKQAKHTMELENHFALFIIPQGYHN